MRGFVGNIEEETLKNDFFRNVLYTDERVQLVVMALRPGEDIGMEVHGLDQFIRVEQGQGRAILDGQEYNIQDGTAVIVPAGTNHNIVNTGQEALKLYTLYAPPNHAPGTVHKTKAEAQAAEEHYEGPAH